MFKISPNGIITVNRGDSFEIPVNLHFGDAIKYTDFEFPEDAVLYLGVMEPNQPFELALIRKKFTYQDLNEDNQILVRFWPEDTECVLPGKYYYQIKLQTVDELTGRYDVETIVDKTMFFIQE